MPTKIGWTNETWNPVVGCSKVSPGCDNCYAERMALRLGFMGHGKYQAVINNPDNVIGGKAGKWTGKTFCDEKALEKPLHWKKPRMIFVCSMGDLFHGSVPFEFVDKVMAVIALCPQHTFQILTKRPERMAEYLTETRRNIPIYNEAAVITKGDWEMMPLDMAQTRSSGGQWWPLSNLWLGVTAENQEMADKRIPTLLQIQVAVRFVSIEPILEKVGLNYIKIGTLTTLDALDGWERDVSPKLGVIASRKNKNHIDWVIVGCESGPGRRECKTEWARDIVDQCKAADVPVFVKQLNIGGKVVKDIDQFPDYLQIREFPKGGE